MCVCARAPMCFLHQNGFNEQTNWCTHKTTVIPNKLTLEGFFFFLVLVSPAALALSGSTSSAALLRSSETASTFLMVSSIQAASSSFFGFSFLSLRDLCTSHSPEMSSGTVYDALFSHTTALRTDILSSVMPTHFNSYLRIPPPPPTPFKQTRNYSMTEAREQRSTWTSHTKHSNKTRLKHCKSTSY